MCSHTVSYHRVNICLYPRYFIEEDSSYAEIIFYVGTSIAIFGITNNVL